MRLKANKANCGCGGVGTCECYASHGHKLHFSLSDKELTYKVYDGRKHLVVPVVMARADVVMNKALTPKEELIPASWNGTPVTVGHPVKDGPTDFISVHSPHVRPKWEVGTIFNARMDGVKLKAEAWIDLERANKLNPKLVAKIEGGKNVDVSTGFFSKDEDQKGELNGRRYTMITRDLKPDHLAILLDEPGACSWADGCGLRTNAPPPDWPREAGRWIAGAAGKAFGKATAALGAAAAVGRTVAEHLKEAPASKSISSSVDAGVRAKGVTRASWAWSLRRKGGLLLAELENSTVPSERRIFQQLNKALDGLMPKDGPTTMADVNAFSRQIDRLRGTADTPKGKAAINSVAALANSLMTRAGLREATSLRGLKARKRKPHTNAPPVDQPRDDKGEWEAGGGSSKGSFTKAAAIGTAAGTALALGGLGAAGKLGAIAATISKAAGTAAAAGKAAASAGIASVTGKVVSPVAGKTMEEAAREWFGRNGFASELLERSAGAREVNGMIQNWIKQMTTQMTPEDLTRIHSRVMSAANSATIRGFGGDGEAVLRGFGQFTRAAMKASGLKTNKGTKSMARKAKVVVEEELDLNANNGDDTNFHVEEDELDLHAEAEEFHAYEDPPMPPRKSKKKTVAMPPQQDAEDQEDGGDDETAEGEDDTVPPSEQLPGNKAGMKKPVTNQEVSMTDIKAMVAEAVKETVTVTLKEIVTNAINAAKSDLITADQQVALKLAANQAQQHKDALVAKIKANTTIPEDVIKTFSLEQLEATAAGILPVPDFSGRLVANAQKLDNEDPAIKAMTAGEHMFRAAFAPAA